jgi:tetratricopeptide (TPR) repeat protein
LFDGLLRENPGNASYRVNLGRCYNDLGTLLGASGRPDQGEECAKTALTYRTQLCQANPENPRWRNDLAQSHHNLGLYYRGKQDDLARQHLEQAAAIRERLIKECPDDSTYRQLLAESYDMLAPLLKQANRRQETYRKAESLLQRLVQDQPQSTLLKVSVTSLSVNWGLFLKETGHPQEALQKFAQAIDLAQAAFAIEPEYQRARQFLVNASGARAQTLMDLSHYGEAIKDWDRVIELTPERNEAAKSRFFRGLCLARAGHHARATTEAKALAQAFPKWLDLLYGAASIDVLSIPAVLQDSGLSSPARHVKAEDYATQAMEALRQAEAAGLRTRPDLIGDLQKSAEFAPLRQRPEFQKWLKTLSVGPSSGTPRKEKPTAGPTAGSSSRSR